MRGIKVAINNETGHINGKFAVGNKFGTGSTKQTPISKCLKASIKDEIIRCAHNITESPREFKEREPRTVLEEFMQDALKKKKWQVVESILDRAVGKPKQQIEHTGDQTQPVQITYSKA